MARHQKELNQRQKIMTYVSCGAIAFIAAIIVVIILVKTVKNPPDIIINSSATPRLSFFSNTTSSSYADVTESIDTSSTDILIQGISDGATYYTTQYAYFTSPDIKTITINGEESEKAFFISGNTNNTYLIQATDNNGYTVTYTVYTKKINSLAETLNGFNQLNVTVDNSDTINSVKNQILKISTKYSPVEETEALDEILNVCDNLLKRISTIQDEIIRITTIASKYDNAEPDAINIAEITSLLEDINALLSTENLTDTQHSALKALVGKCNFLISTTQQVKPRPHVIE